VVGGIGGWWRSGGRLSVGEGDGKWSGGLGKEEKELWVAPVGGGVMSSGGARGGGSGGAHGDGVGAASDPGLCVDQRASRWQWTRWSRRDAGDRQEQKE
jgi:hypothetical protein